MSAAVDTSVALGAKLFAAFRVDKHLRTLYNDPP